MGLLRARPCLTQYAPVPLLAHSGMELDFQAFPGTGKAVGGPERRTAGEAMGAAWSLEVTHHPHQVPLWQLGHPSGCSPGASSSVCFRQTSLQGSTIGMC